MSPRPILKRPAPLGCTSPGPHPAVHFPPSPSLTTHTFAAHSSTAYDRSPIQVSPNSCALPERGCPGRTYTLDEPHRRFHSSRGLHPRALHRPQRDAPLPPLIPDLSDESDESDAPQPCFLGLVVPPDRFFSAVSPAALSFLPHPPAFPDDDDDDDDDTPAPKPRRRRERKHDPSRTPDRIPDATPSKKRVPVLARACHTLSSFRIEDDGCLGGF